MEIFVPPICIVRGFHNISCGRNVSTQIVIPLSVGTYKMKPLRNISEQNFSERD